MIDVALTASTFAAIFLAELPDKSMFASMVMATRMRARYVWLGIASAFAVHVTIAALAGSLISLLPRSVVLAAVTLLFFAGAALLLLKKESAEEAEHEAEEHLGARSGRSPGRVIATAFGVVFVSEWGDLTQITTVSRVAESQDPLSVGLGALSALWLVAGLGVVLGRRLVRIVPLAVIRRVAGLVFLALALWALGDLIRELW